MRKRNSKKINKTYLYNEMDILKATEPYATWYVEKQWSMLCLNIYFVRKTPWSVDILEMLQFMGNRWLKSRVLNFLNDTWKMLVISFCGNKTQNNKLLKFHSQVLHSWQDGLSAEGRNNNQ